MQNLDSGETLDGELIYLEIAEHLDEGDPFHRYNEALRRYVKIHAVQIGHGKDLIWGTWNDGSYNMVHDFIVRRNTDFIREHLPSVTWIQIDDGYESKSDVLLAYDPTNPDTGFGLARLAHYHYGEEENEGICARKFPEGMKAVADYIKSRGLRPALWTGLNVTPHARLVQEHPEWFQDNLNTGDALSYLNPDISIPECLAFIKEGFRRIIRDWGFEGVKLDFWTYGFIANQRPFSVPYRYSKGNKTGLEYMHELLSYLRELLGDGYMETACDISCGNPFLAPYVDNFRYSIDMGDGDWTKILLAARWMSFHALAAHRLGYLANSDTVGVMLGLPDTIRRTWMNFCFISGSLLEIGGDFVSATAQVDKDYIRQGRPQLLEKTFGSPPSILQELRKITAKMENGRKVFFPDPSYLNGDLPPSVWVKCDESETPAYVGVFNWSEIRADVPVPAEFLNRFADNTLVDFWTDRLWNVPVEGSIDMEGCHSLLLRIAS